MSELDKWIVAALEQFGPVGKSEHRYDLTQAAFVPLLKRVRDALRSFDIALFSSPNDIPQSGTNIAFVARKPNRSLHFRVFDENGERVIDKSEAQVIEEQRLKGGSRSVDALKMRLNTLNETLQKLARPDSARSYLKHDAIDTVLAILGLDCFRAAKVRWRYGSFGLRLVRVDQGESLPIAGARLIIIARTTWPGFRLRVFDGDGKRVADVDSEQFASASSELVELDHILAPYWGKKKLPKEAKQSALWTVESLLRRTEQQCEAVRNVVLAFGCGWGRQVGLVEDRLDPFLERWHRRWPRACSELYSRVRRIAVRELKALETKFRVEGLDLKGCLVALTREPGPQPCSANEDEEAPDSGDSEDLVEPQDTYTTETDIVRDNALDIEPTDQAYDIETTEANIDERGTQNECTQPVADESITNTEAIPLALRVVTDMVIQGGSILHRMRQLEEADLAETFTEDCVLKWDKFIQRLANNKDPLSRFVWEKLDQDVRRDCVKWHTLPRPEKDRLQEEIVKTVENIIKIETIHDEDRFAGINLSETTQECLMAWKENRHSEGACACPRLNRALFEDGFDDLILRCATPRKLDHNEENAKTTDNAKQLSAWCPGKCTLENYLHNLVKGPVAGPAAFSESLLFLMLHISYHLQCEDVWTWRCDNCGQKVLFYSACPNPDCKKPFDPLRDRGTRKRSQYFVPTAANGSHIKEKFRKCSKCENIYPRIYKTCALLGCTSSLFDGFDIRLVSDSEGTEHAGVPDAGAELIVISRTNGKLHLRVFKANGEVEDQDETRLKVGFAEFESLKKCLDRLDWRQPIPPQQRTALLRDVARIFHLVKYSTVTLWQFVGRIDIKSIFKPKENDEKHFEYDPSLTSLPAPEPSTEDPEKEERLFKTAQFLVKWIQAGWVAFQLEQLDYIDWIWLLKYFMRERREFCPELDASSRAIFTSQIEGVLESLKPAKTKPTTSEMVILSLFARFCLAVLNVDQAGPTEVVQTATALRIKHQDLSVLLDTLNRRAPGESESPFTEEMAQRLGCYVRPENTAPDEFEHE